ncbi:MAG: septal ring factor EnvC (AmiA/AmiB activator) [Alphaproteobacteria bacterium]|jgi:septal ring factor EnvC (AmiA/AmiB activator)
MPLPRHAPHHPYACPTRGHIWRMSTLFLGFAALNLCGLSSSALAQSTQGKGRTPQQLEAVERESSTAHARAEALARETERLTQEAEDTARKLVIIARDTRTHEQAIADLRQHLAQITVERKQRSAGLEKKRGRLAQLLAALQRIARHPPEALMAYTHTPQDMLRGAMLLRAAIPKLEADAHALRIELETLARLSEQAAARRNALAREQAELKTNRKSLAALALKKRGLLRTTRAEQEKADARSRKLARQARNLRELLAGVERNRKKARKQQQLKHAPQRQTARLTRPHKPSRPKSTAGIFSRARGRLTQPVIGRVATAFGVRPKGAPVAAKGVRFTTRPGAQVVTPFGGEIVFSGPFRGYGPLLIIDHGEGYHSLLAGLGRIDAAVGQKLLAGEPIGIMPRTAKETLRLYMELRRDGRPIDPLPWLEAPPNSKVSG